MIKLVASDIDGTLVPEGTDQIDPELFEMIRELKKRGIMFAVASGRQYVSMRSVFEPVADDVIFIAENGSNVMCRGKNMSSSFIDQKVAEELLLYLREQKEGDIILSTPEMLYLDTPNEAFKELLENGYHNKVVRVPDLLPYCSRTNKIAVYYADGVDEKAEQMKEKFGTRLNVVVAGARWVDFINDSVDKGNALETIQNFMKIRVEETMAFGDNCNDIGMLRQAGESYAVANAHPQLKAAAKHIAPPQQENGVLQIIRRELLS
ncbi:MAG: HAD family phosphatase [Lachnospiraceae bacterium]|jgi:Cof subfamily protein (haloacid dehalogenase superfamily)|nr:HAD family phosphatase [Lachnospiraceae bacterium]RKJ48868.1 HAD family phosphatase [bacterium 1XD42-54]